MPRTNYVKKAQPRYETVPVIDPETGEQKKTPVMKNGVQRKKKNGALIFRRVTMEDKSKPKPNRKCEKCGKEIEVGSPYKWVQIKTTYGGIKKVRCGDCPGWKPSELSMSKMSGVYAAQEEADDTDVSSIEDLEALRESIAEQIEAVGEEYEQSGQNMEDGFEHATSMSDELKEKGESIKNWADEIRNVDFDEVPDCEECNGEGTKECESCEGTGTMTEDAMCEDCNGAGTTDCTECEEGSITEGSEAYNEWLEEQKGKLIDEVNNCPV
jgi:hypothetical protein